MFIWWGTQSRSEPLGVVVDRCGACGQIALHTAVQHFRVSHIYSIPLGRGTPQATSVQCGACSVDLLRDLRHYAWLASYQQSSTLPLKELMRVTNPVLLEAVERRERLEEMVRNPAAAPVATAAPSPTPNAPAPGPAPAPGGATVAPAPAADPKVQLALEDLRDVQDYTGSDELFAELEKWPALDEPARAALLARIEKFVANSRAFRRALGFIRLMGVSCPSGGMGCGLSLFAPLALLSAFIWWPATRSWLWGILLVLATLVSWLLTFIVASDSITRSWVRKTFVVHGDQQGIRYDIIVHVLFYLADPANASANENMGNVATSKDEIIQTLIETGRVDVDEAGNYSTRWPAAQPG